MEAQNKCSNDGMARTLLTGNLEAHGSQMAVACVLG
jgi:hypothetical protein